jgi:hypothetical protein
MHKQLLESGLKPISRAVAEKRLEAISLSFFEAIDTPKSLACALLFKYKEFAQLVSMDVNPLDYLNSELFADDYVACKFLSKFPSFKHADLDPTAAAWNKFLECENACLVTNRRFRELREDPLKWDPMMRGILLLARRKIAHVLGTPDLDTISALFGWGPGATTVAKGNLTSAYVKFSQRLDVTGNSLVMGMSCVNSTPSWVNCQLLTDSFPSVPASLLERAFTVVRGNEIVFVPKNAKTDRVIAKEPHVNSYLQKGFGSYIRSRLLRFAGIDLRDQSRNQHLARFGSLSGELATIDLSGASDTISKELVHFLLPDSWYKLLATLRSNQGLSPDGSWFFYEKFSSMGNAYTFELESLIFWALCSATIEVNGTEQTLSVYGDDIIVNVAAFEPVSKVLQFAGFSLNDSKSFSSGPFRESCGKDYFEGRLVRPIFLKEELSNVESLYRLANSIRRYSRRRYNYGCDGRFRVCYEAIVSLIPKSFRFKIPEGYGDGGLVSNFDEAVPFLCRKPFWASGWEGYFFKTVVQTAVKRQMLDGHAGYTATLSVIGSAFDPQKRSLLSFRRGEDVMRLDGSPLLGYHSLRRMTRPKVARVHTSGWYDFGPWI